MNKVKSVGIKTVLMSSVALGCMVSAPLVYAQDQDEVKVEEIMVTARRREETLQEVPIAVTSFSGAELEKEGVQDISEIANRVPSTTLETSRATNNTLTAFIRGVGQQDPLAGFEPGVAIYLDDVYLARPQGALLDVYDVERVEVLRGPQGTLYGRNAVGGAIKYVTKRLSDEKAFNMRASMGSYGQKDVVARASVPMSETLRMGIAAASLNRDGFGKNLTLGTENYNKEVLALRGTLEWTPVEDVFVRLAYDHMDDDSNPRHGYRVNDGAFGGVKVLDNVYDTYAGAEANASTSGINGNNELKMDGVSATVEYRVNDMLTLKSITANRTDRTESVIDFDSLAIDDLDAAVIYDNKQFTQEFIATYTGDRLSGTMGFFYLDASAANDFDVVLGQLGRIAYGSALTAYTGGVVDTKAWAAYADFDYELTEDLNLSLGGRYTSDKRSADVLRQAFLGTPSKFFGNDSAIGLPPSSDFTSEKTFKDFSPRAVLDYAFAEGINTYVSYSSAFKAGSFDPRGANIAIPDGSVEEGFDPETLDTIEAGVKMTLPDNIGTLNIALFDSKYKDMQIPGSLPVDTDNDGTNDDFVGTVTNAGRASIKGIEVESFLRLNDRLSLQAAVSILDAKIDEWIFNGVSIANQRYIQNTPEFMGYVGVNYVMPVSNGDVTFNASVSRKGKTIQYEFAIPEIDQPAYSLTDFNAVWVDENNVFSIGFHAKNLFDKRYKVAGYPFGAPYNALGLENNIVAFYGAPRTFTVTVGMNF